MKLMKVKSRCLLQWPLKLQQGPDVTRGAAGYVVDLEVPIEAEWCAGQMHKLEPAPEAKAPTKIVQPQALRALKDWQPPSPPVESAPAPVAHSDDELEEKRGLRAPKAKAVPA